MSTAPASPISSFSIDGAHLLNALSAALVLTLVPWQALGAAVYLSTSLVVFAVLATINHLAPSRLRRLTHVVKAAYTQVLAASVAPLLHERWSAVVVAVAVVVTVCDLVPLLLSPAAATRPRGAAVVAEGVGAVARAAAVVVGFVAVGLPVLAMTTYVACSAVYVFERRARIAAGRRHDYSALHALEHVALQVLLGTLNARVLDVDTVVIAWVVMIAPLVLALIVSGVTFNALAWRATRTSVPPWFDPRVRPHLDDKARANAKSTRLQHYVIKPFTPKIASRRVRWQDIERLVDALPDGGPFDVVVGVLSGGAFIAPLVARRYGVGRVVYARSRLWSQLSFARSARASFRYYAGREHRTVVTFLDDEAAVLRGARVLVVDDSVCTGTTIASVRAACEREGAVVVVTAALFCDPAHPTDLHAIQSRTPLVWPWGWESD